MSANTVSMHVTSHHDVTKIAIKCDAICTNCRFLKTGLVDYIGVQQTPIELCSVTTLHLTCCVCDIWPEGPIRGADASFMLNTRSPLPSLPPNVIIIHRDKNNVSVCKHARVPSWHSTMNFSDYVHMHRVVLLICTIMANLCHGFF